MLKPAMNDLLKRVGNRYLLVNLAAQRARDISAAAEETGESLTEKPVKMALDEIAAGTIVYRPGPREDAAPDIAEEPSAEAEAETEAPAEDVQDAAEEGE